MLTPHPLRPAGVRNPLGALADVEQGCITLLFTTSGNSFAGLDRVGATVSAPSLQPPPPPPSNAPTRL